MAKDPYQKTVVTEIDQSFPCVKKSNFLFHPISSGDSIYEMHMPWGYELEFTENELVKQKFVQDFIINVAEKAPANHTFYFGRFALQESLSFTFEGKEVELYKERLTYDPVLYVFDNLSNGKPRTLVKISDVPKHRNINSYHNACITWDNIKKYPDDPCFLLTESSFMEHGQNVRFTSIMLTSDLSVLV
ncbi:MAG: hypothetical protein V4478_01645 [Patescibacteria group bacterium]